MFLTRFLIAVLLVTVIVCLGHLSGRAQSSGTTCYDTRTHQRVPCSRPAPRPVQPPPSSSRPAPDNSAQIEAERRAAEEKRRQEEADRAARAAEAERQRIERERQENFEREKRDALDSLKGTHSGSPQLKGAISSGELLKGTDTPAFQLKGLNSPTKNAGPLQPEALLVMEFMALAKRLKWGADDLTRLEKAMKELDIAEWHERTVKDVETVWSSIRNRKQPDELIEIAEKTKGWNIPAVGKQTNSECAVYAMANASGLPYDYVRGRAVYLIDQGDWRPLPDQINTDRTVKTGLTGGELLLLAESLGQVEIVKNEDFRRTLASGRPVMIDVFAVGKTIGQHQVVLSRTFQHGGQTWYEMIDSHLPGEWDRRYLTEEELKLIQVENGIVFHPEPKLAAPKRPVTRKAN